MFQAFTVGAVKAGRLVALGIAKGAYGASIVFTDISSADKLAADAVSLPEEATDRALPIWLLESPAEDGQASYTRPDLILVTPSTSCPPTEVTKPALIPARNRDIHLVEIKYCEDTRPKGQLQISKRPNATMLLPLRSMMAVEWVAVPRPGTHQTLISLGAVVSWFGGWGSLGGKGVWTPVLLPLLHLLNAGGD